MKLISAEQPGSDKQAGGANHQAQRRAEGKQQEFKPSAGAVLGKADIQPGPADLGLDAVACEDSRNNDKQSGEEYSQIGVSAPSAVFMLRR